MEGDLYGLSSSNRKGSDLWGKNQFNSTFPMALCCYMRDNGMNPVYISFEQEGQFRASDNEIAFDRVFGTVDPNIRFEFEAEFTPIKKLFADSHTQRIDVVISQNINGEWHNLKALEVKLTVLPDESTSKKSEDEWSSELVIRPVTSAYAMLLIWNRLPDQKQNDLRDLVADFITSKYKIQDWENKNEVLGLADRLHSALFNVARICNEYQEPYLVQPIWKTVGKSPELAENCLDVFVWSDLATVMLSHDLSRIAVARTEREMIRPLREVVRHICCISKLAREEFIYEEVYGAMGFGLQTDKSFSISGSNTIMYMKHPRLRTPILRPDILPSIIIGGGEKNLSPERRFDATIYFERSIRQRSR
ncbi:MAG: HindVP family restriction endonuclease [bacterium]|nr:HindVP family restriction endonuclease [bacterium]